MSDKYDRLTGAWFCMLLILLAVLSRLLPHPPNFTPIAALGLFTGSCLHMRKFWLVPVTALLLSDLVIGFYHPVAMVFVYTGFVLCACIGHVFLRARRNVFRLGAATLTGAVLFFIISNFGDWLTGLNYPLTWQGLVACYTMAVPFFRNTLIGDLFYVVFLFGTFAIYDRWFRHARGPSTIPDSPLR